MGHVKTKMEKTTDKKPLIKPGGDTKRQKIIKTLWIFWAIMLVGFTNGILGPTVLGLLQLTHTSMLYINWVFMGQGLGFACGVIFTTFLSSRVSPYICLSAAIFLAAGVNSALPWMRSFSLLSATIFGQFFLKGMVYYGTMFLCGLIWPHDNDVPYQFIVTGLGLGAFVSPFFVYMALSEDIPLANVQNITEENSMVDCHTGESNVSLVPIVCSHIPINTDYIFVPYLLVAVIVLPPAMAFAYYACRGHNEARDKLESEETYESLSDVSFEENDEKKRKTSKTVYWAVMLLLMLFYVPFGGILLSFSHLLSAFGIKSKLHMPDTSMAIMTSVYWGCCLLGRSINTFLSAYFDLFLIILCNFIGLIVANLSLVFMANEYEIALWLGTAFTSLFNSMFLPGVMTWIGAYLDLDGVGICLSLVGLAFGELVWPIFGGYAFNTFGPMSLMYLTFALVCFQFSLFLALQFIVCTKLRKLP